MGSMENLIALCKWPDLPEKYALALRQAVAFILERYAVSGIIASGTIIRGSPDPASDLDIYVVHRAGFRQRVQKFFNDVPAEIFVNPPQAIEGYLKEEQAERRPLTAHMLATGFVILERDPVVGQLREKAGNLLANPPGAPRDLTYQRYMAALLYEDALDIQERDPEAAEMILQRAVVEMMNFCFIQAGAFMPRSKSLIAEFSKAHPATGELARSFYREASLVKKIALAGQIADQTIGRRGFFEWEATPEEVGKLSNETNSGESPGAA